MPLLFGSVRQILRMFIPIVLFCGNIASLPKQRRPLTGGRQGRRMEWGEKGNRQSVGFHCENHFFWSSYDMLK